MIAFLILMAKIFLFALPFIFLMGLVNIVIGNLGRLFSGSNYLQLFYSIIATLAYIYVYSFWAAYLKAIVVTYSEIYQKKWLLILLCFISIIPPIAFINKQLQEEKAKMNKAAISAHFSFSSGTEAYLLSINVIGLSVVIILPISFIVFLFTGSLHDTLFFELPKYLSNLFL
jgi:hypothetical protein